MKYNIGKFLIILTLFVFYKYEIINAKTDEEVFLGNKNASVTVIEYASMTCGGECATSVLVRQSVENNDFASKNPGMLRRR